MLGRKGDGEALVAWLSIRCPILLAGVGRRFHLFRRQTVIAQDSVLCEDAHISIQKQERGTIKQMLNHESSHMSSLLKSEGALLHPLS